MKNHKIESKFRGVDNYLIKMKNLLLYASYTFNVITIIVIINLNIQNLGIDAEIERLESTIKSDAEHISDFDFQYFLTDYAIAFNRSDIKQYVMKKHLPAHDIKEVQWYIESGPKDTILEWRSKSETAIENLKKDRRKNNEWIIKLGIVEVLVLTIDLVIRINKKRKK